MNPLQNSLKRNIDIILYRIIPIAGLIILIVGLIGQCKHNRLRECVGYDIQVLDGHSNKFVKAGDVALVIDNEFGNCHGRKSSEINLYDLENLLLGKGVIDECVSYITGDGVLHVEISQSSPLACIVADDGKYYMDIRGKCFPVSEEWCPGIKHIEGDKGISDDAWNQKIAKMAEWIVSGTEWRDIVSGFECDADGNLTMSIADRDEKFIIGQPDRYEDNFRRIGIYLDKIGNNKTYKTVNVKFKGQIVCK